MKRRWPLAATGAMFLMIWRARAAGDGRIGNGYYYNTITIYMINELLYCNYTLIRTVTTIIYYYRIITRTGNTNLLACFHYYLTRNCAYQVRSRELDSLPCLKPIDFDRWPCSNQKVQTIFCCQCGKGMLQGSCTYL